MRYVLPALPAACKTTEDMTRVGQGGRAHPQTHTTASQLKHSTHSHMHTIIYNYCNVFTIRHNLNLLTCGVS